MNDRELLELAAKAAGILLVWDGDSPKEVTEHWSCDPTEPPHEREWDWNPLTDDGDALRLAVRLNLAVVLHPALNQAIVRPYHTRDMNRECREDCEKHTDHFAATRHAIVRAAAEIGRQMQEGGAA